MLQPVLVRPLPGGTYELIAGERRWRAAQIAGLESVPAIVRPDDDAASLELALIENMAREDLNPLEEARACAALVEELGLTRDEVGRRVGRSRVAVSNLLRLLDLPDLALMLIEDGSLSEGHGRALLMAPDHDARRRLAREAATKGWSVRQTEERARAAAGATTERSRRAAPASPHPDQLEAAERVGEAFGARARRRRPSDPKARRLPRSARVRFARRGTRGGRAPGRRRDRLNRLARAGAARYHPRARGRLAQSVRALL